MGEPINHVINPKQLFHDLKLNFPEVPDTKILDIIHRHGLSHDLCMEALNIEIANYVPHHVNDMSALSTGQQLSSLQISQPTEDPAVYTNNVGPTSLHASSSTSRLRPQLPPQDSPLRSNRSQPQLGYGERAERFGTGGTPSPRLPSPRHPHGSPSNSPFLNRSHFEVGPPSRNPGVHWDPNAIPPEYYGAGMPGRSTASQSSPTAASVRSNQYTPLDLSQQPWAFPVRPPYGANPSAAHARTDLPSRPNQFPGGFPTPRGGVQGSPQRPSAISQSSQEGMVPNANSSPYGYKPGPGVGSPGSPHRAVPYTGSANIPDPNGAFFIPATSQTTGFRTYGPPNVNQPISFPTTVGYNPYPPQTLASQPYSNTSVSYSNHSTPPHHGTPSYAGVPRNQQEDPVHSMRPLPMSPGAVASPQLIEDPAYTRALIKHQIARRDKLRQDLEDSNRVLEILRVEVSQLERRLRNRQAESGNRAHNPHALLHAARQKNQTLLMNIQLASTEIDMYNNSNVDFHTTIDPRPGGNPRNSLNTVPTTPTPSPDPTMQSSHSTQSSSRQSHQGCDQGPLSLSVPPPRPPPPQPSPQPPPPAYRPGLDEVSEPAAQSEEETQWACSRCTFLNFSGLNKCEICEMPKLIPVFSNQRLGQTNGNYNS